MATPHGVLLAAESDRLMSDLVGVWWCEPREPSVARAAAAITLKVPNCPCAIAAPQFPTPSLQAELLSRRSRRTV
jgi:hypothetical protein